MEPLVDGEKVAAAARRYVGTRFRHRGRTAHGLDCAGLVIVARNEAFGTTDDFQSYSRRPDADVVFAVLNQYADRITQRDARAGDVVQLVWNGRPVHLGILTDVGTVIHASEVAGAVVERPRVIKGNGRVVAAWRLKGCSWPS